MKRAMSGLEEPTDTEIQEEIGTRFPSIPVGFMSSRPEDLPHFRPSIFDDYLPHEKDARIQSVVQTLRDFCPGYEPPEGDVNQKAFNRAANILIIKMWHGGRYSWILRPSKLISPALDISNATGLPKEHIKSRSSESHNRAIGTWHEMGHLYGYFANKVYRTHYDEELDAESFALQRYLERGGKKETLEEVVQQRALSGFLRQPSQYFLAPALKARFLDKTKDFPSFTSVWESYAELRLRVSSRIEGDDFFKKKSSVELGFLLHRWNRGQHPYAGSDKEIRKIDQYLKKIDDPSSLWRQDPRAVFSALKEELRNPEISSRTKRYGKQIMQAGHALVPDLMPQRRFWIF